MSEPLTSLTDSPAALRARARRMRMSIRKGEYTEQTGGKSPGIVMGNVVILPVDWAVDFLLFCRANPKPCPVISVSEPCRSSKLQPHPHDDEGRTLKNIMRNRLVSVGDPMCRNFAHLTANR
jgi:uncharacterized protein YcsI (UPF0317 family)